MTLIDGDELRKTMYHEAFETDTDMQRWDSGCWIRYKMFLNALQNAPTIEAEPVRHGKWIKMSDADGHYYACSECGNELARIEIYNPHHDLPPKLKSIGKTRYCPNCGAKMDEVEI